jgi:hypothetical protein
MVTARIFWRYGSFSISNTFVLIAPPQYSLLVAGTISIGHVSTTALAAATLASMTATVTGFSIMQGFLSSLDTLLPGAWTSSNPRLVGLWCQRVCMYPNPILALRPRLTPRFSQPSSSSFCFS